MVRISPSWLISTPEPARRNPKVSADRAFSVAVTFTPTTDVVARANASIMACAAGGGGVAAWAAPSSKLERRRQSQ
jgi:hypothetical protein